MRDTARDTWRDGARDVMRDTARERLREWEDTAAARLSFWNLMASSYEYRMSTFSPQIKDLGRHTKGTNSLTHSFRTAVPGQILFWRTEHIIRGQLRGWVNQIAPPLYKMICMYCICVLNTPSLFRAKRIWKHPFLGKDDSCESAQTIYLSYLSMCTQSLPGCEGGVAPYCSPALPSAPQTGYPTAGGRGRLNRDPD